MNVPKCLKSHLRTISLLQFKGLEHELKLITYMLKNAKVLQRMDILSGSSSYEKNFRILNKLVTKLPRASSTCELKFSTVLYLSHEFYIELYFIMITYVKF